MVVKTIGFRVDEHIQNLIKQFKIEETMDGWFLARFNEWASKDGLNPAFYEAQAQLLEAEVVRLRQKALAVGAEAKKLEIVQEAVKTAKPSRPKAEVGLEQLIDWCRKIPIIKRRGWASSEVRRPQIEEHDLSIDDFLQLVEGEVSQ
jgi:hypothetical protein